MMTHDELLRRSIDAAFSGNFTAAFNVSEKKGDTRRPIADDDDRDESDSDAAEREFIDSTVEKELREDEQAADEIEDGAA